MTITAWKLLHSIASPTFLPMMGGKY